MQKLIPTSQRRFIRLKSYLEPYRKLRLDVSREIRTPLRIKPAKGGYQLSVSEYLLQLDAPAWVEKSILRCVRFLVLGSKEASELVESEYKKLDSFLQTKLPSKQPKRKLSPRASPSIKESKDLRELWVSLQEQYFPERKDVLDYTVLWSNRKHTRTLASCNVYKKRMIVAGAMRLDEAAPYLSALVYHEMCHAALGKPEVKNGRRVIHGREFKALERRHPGIPALDSWIHAGGWHQLVRLHEHQKKAAALRA